MSRIENIERQPCALTPGGADQEFCGRNSKLSHNQSRCSGCTSPWRLCNKCVVSQKVTTRSIVHDPDSGLCQDHAMLELQRQSAVSSDRDSMMKMLGKSGTEVQKIPIEKIRPRADQPRQHFDPVELENLAASLKEVGQIEAVIVVPIEPDEHGHEYELDDGERRWRASKNAGLKELNAIVVPEHLDDGLRYLRSSVANFNREGHTLLEKVDMVVRLVDKEGFSQAAVARALGKHPVWVNQHYSLRRLHSEVRARLGVDVPPNEKISFLAALRLAPLQHDLQLAAAPGMVGTGTHEHTQVIVRVAERHGMSYDRRSRAPSDDFKSIITNAKTAADRLSVLVTMSDDDWSNAFRHQVQSNLIALSLQVQRLEEQSKKALERLQKEFPEDE